MSNKIKKAILASLQPEQLKELCNNLGIEADRRSHDAMLAGLSSAKRAKPEVLAGVLKVSQLREILEELDIATQGNKDELLQRLLGDGGDAGNGQTEEPGVGDVAGTYRTARRRRGSGAEEATEQYRHTDQAVQRPDAGVQDQFTARKPPRTYSYDSSLDPALSWDEQRERDLGEWLLGLVVSVAKEGEASVFAEPQVWKGGGVRITSTADAAQMLQQISKPFLNWAGKAERHEIRVPTSPLFVHERHSTKAILDGIRHRKARGQTLDLFGDPGLDIRENLEAYEHKGPWQNRMILGDSLSVMNSLLEFEGLAGQVQMIYIDPPYGVKFGSNFQPFVRKRDVKHGGDDDMTREPEMVKAYRDTWELGLHSYLTYLRDRLLIARELLHESGSVFVQISDTNLHHVRGILDEVFGAENFLSLISYVTTSGFDSSTLSRSGDHIIWFAKNAHTLKFRRLYRSKNLGSDGAGEYKYLFLPNGTQRPMTKEEASGVATLPDNARPFRYGPLTSSGANLGDSVPFRFNDGTYTPGANNHWKVGRAGMERLAAKDLLIARKTSLAYRLFLDWYPVEPIANITTVRLIVE